MSSAATLSVLRPETATFEGLKVNIHRGGAGRPLLLLHGSGPGASTIGNWRLVIDELARSFQIVAIDLIGFGESDRKPAPPYFDFGLWLRQARWALDLFDGDASIGVIGHSISGSLALQLAAQDARVDAVMTTGTMGAPRRANAWLGDVWRCPPSRDAMRDAARTLIADERLITDAYLDARMAIIGSPEYRAYFDQMFEGDFQPYLDASVIPPANFPRISARVLMLHGREDKAFPAEDGSLALLPHLPGADCILIGGCSHSVAMERPDLFLAAARLHFDR